MLKTNGVKIFFIKNKHIIYYLFFGAITIMVSFGTYWLCYDILCIPNLISNAISWITAVTVSFISSKIWVFNSKKWTVKVVIPEIIKFAGVRFFTFFFEEIIMGITVDLFHYNGILMKFLTGIGAITINYIFSRVWVFHVNGQFAKSRKRSMTKDIETRNIEEIK